jgi:FKBP-type peptidyl-prolyl cis-trans isomerase (trigger factor)
MKVTLNISEDAELRAHIKDAIKGQVASIMREEIRGVLQEVLTGKISASTLNPDSLIQDEIRKLVKAQLDNGSWGTPSYIQKVARELVNQQVLDALKSRNTV